MSSTESPDLTAVEARVLAALMEKQLATPDNYPLTLNSLVLACNQKSNREPVMALTAGEVGHTIRELEGRKLARLEFGERTERVRHCMNVAYFLDPKQQAILTVLMLRRPLTLNEIRARTERMVNFDGVEEILVMLDEMMERAKPFIICLPKGPGQREDRYSHTLCGAVEPISPERPERVPREAAPAHFEGERVEALEARVEALEAQMASLLSRLEGGAASPSTSGDRPAGER